MDVARCNVGDQVKGPENDSYLGELVHCKTKQKVTMKVSKVDFLTSEQYSFSILSFENVKRKCFIEARGY